MQARTRRFGPLPGFAIASLLLSCSAPARPQAEPNPQRTTPESEPADAGLDAFSAPDARPALPAELITFRDTLDTAADAADPRSGICSALDRLHQKIEPLIQARPDAVDEIEWGLAVKKLQLGLVKLETECAKPGGGTYQVRTRELFVALEELEDLL